MVKDNRKTKENSKNQEQFINWIKEYFETAPIIIYSDKTKIYIRHKNYPIVLENTSIIERFTNKNKGIVFTKEQAIKEAERLRNELAVEVRNYKTEGISIIQNLIKEHLNETFGAENTTDIKFIGDCVVSFKYKDVEVNSINYEEEIYYLMNNNHNSLVDLELSDFESEVEGYKYDSVVEDIVTSIIAPELEKLEGTNCSVDFSADEINITYNNEILEKIWSDEGYDFTVNETIDYIISEVKLIVEYILSSFAEQAECAKFAEENYKTDVSELLYNTECYLLNQNLDAEMSLPDFHTDGFYIHNFRFKLEFDTYKSGHYEINIDDNYVFEQNGFWYNKDVEYNSENCELYNDKAPWSPKINYSAFLETLREELFKLEEEILEDFSK